MTQPIIETEIVSEIEVVVVKEEVIAEHVSVGSQGPRGPRGVEGPEGPAGEDFPSDPLAYYILAKA